VSDRLLDAQEIAELLGVPVGWVRQATRDGRLPVVRLGRYCRYDHADVAAWVEKQKTGGRAAASFRSVHPVPNGGTK
jgi:excisionase family DNA binding protein